MLLAQFAVSLSTIYALPNCARILKDFKTCHDSADIA